MIWLLQDFDLLAVLLRALSLSLEALAVGGVLFLWMVATPHLVDPAGRAALRRFSAWLALVLAGIQIVSAAVSSATLMSNGLSLHEVATAEFFRADCVLVAAALAVFAFLRFGRGSVVPALIASVVVVCASVLLSHAASQLDHRWVLLILTAAHHLGAAVWIGAMPSLLVAMRRTEDTRQAHVLAARFSKMSIVGVALIIVTGGGLSYFYVASWQGLYGTSYGVLLLAKCYLLLLALVLGASNFFLVRHTRGNAAPVLIRLRRFSEVEIGLIFTAIIAAASMTSQSPARDMGGDQVTGHQIVQRMEWKWPTLHSPAFARLEGRISLKAALQRNAYSGGSDNDAGDRAWSEYNHHWAGLIVLGAGLFALLARSGKPKWAQNWPLLFLALAVFIVLRADAETWPLGWRPFWATFAEPEVLEHRFFAALIAAFALFEWAVETGRVTSQRAALVFPALCAVAGASLLTHTHGFGEDEQNEMLVQLSHAAIAILGVTAGWARWLQIRSKDSKASRVAGWVWPVCFILVGILLLDYREGAAVQASVAWPPF